MDLSLLFRFIAVQLNLSWTLAFWGPDSKDTGGILNWDWQTTDDQKLELLKPIMHENFL